MITPADITATDAPPTALAIPDQTRGERDYPLDGWDLIAFGRSPDRWVNTPKPEPDDKPDFGELVRMLHLTPQFAPAHYIQRPATYQAMFNVCPTCGSASAAKICRACNLPAPTSPSSAPGAPPPNTAPRGPRTPSAASLRIVPDGRLGQGRHRCRPAQRRHRNRRPAQPVHQPAQPHAASGTTRKPNLDIPLRSLLSYAPAGGRSHDDKLGSLTITRDASPLPWAAAAYNRGKHIVAALKQDLYAAATNDPRPTHVWVLVERDEPHIIGRRRTTPEMLIAGRTALDELMAAYAKCLKTGLWPAFDPDLPGAQEAWSQFHLEPWMTQGDGGATAFFGVTNAPSSRQTTNPMPTHTRPELVWVRYNPRKRAVSLGGLSLASRARAPSALRLHLERVPWPAPDFAKAGRLSRVPRESWDTVLAELHSVGWRTRNGQLFHPAVASVLNEAQPFRRASHAAPKPPAPPAPLITLLQMTLRQPTSRPRHPVVTCSQ